MVMMSLKMDDRLLRSQQNQKEIGQPPIVNTTKTNVNEIPLRHVLLIENIVLITLMRHVLPIANTVLTILKKSGKGEIMWQHVPPIADTVPVTLLLAVLSLAEKPGVESTHDSSQSVNNGTLTAHADFAASSG